MNQPHEIRLEIENMLANKSYSEALSLLSRVERERGLTPRELVIKGRCLQIAPADTEEDLPDAEKAFKDALDIDPEYVPALLELGFFHFAVKDDAKNAMPFFEKVIEIERSRLTEAALGKCSCLEELWSTDRAAAFLQDLNSNALLSDQLDDERKGWLR